jgi:two-component system response regulator HydG
VNVRVLSATNRDLDKAIAEGAFRRDLYHRLKVVTVDLPPLRARRDDILPLAEHFRKHFARRHKKVLRGISGAATRHLFAYDWPGNVRQLRNIMESMVVIDVDGILDLDDLPPELTPASEAAVVEAGANEAAGGLIGQPLSEIERWAVEKTLQLTGGNREETARILGIGARTLYRKIKEYGL